MASSIEGVEKLLARLDGTSDAVREELRNTLDRSGRTMVGLARALAPHGVTGRLEQSIRAEVDAGGLGVTVKAGGPLTTKSVRDGSSVPYDYSKAQEFGTSDMDRNPFFYPAFRSIKRTIRSNLRRAIRRGIAKGG